MRVLAAVVLLSLCLVPVAMAKFKMGLAVSDNTPAVRQPVTVVVRSDDALEWNLKLIAVAPGKGWYDVVGRVTGDSSIARANIPHDGFWVPLKRIGPNRWRGGSEVPACGPLATGRPELGAGGIRDTAAADATYRRALAVRAYGHVMCSLSAA